MDHLKTNWDKEIVEFRAAARSQKLQLSIHAQKRMVQRELTALDVMMVILTGRIVEGFDIGRYPHFRNPDPLRVVVSEVDGRKIAVGVAIQSRGSFAITTCYIVTSSSRFYKFF